MSSGLCEVENSGNGCSGMTLAKEIDSVLLVGSCDRGEGHCWLAGITLIAGTACFSLVDTCEVGGPEKTG